MQIPRYGNDIPNGGSSSSITATLTSVEGAHAATTSITDLSNGVYGISYRTTRAGLYSAVVNIDNAVVKDGSFPVSVAAGVAERAQSFACHHEGSGCYDRNIGSAANSCSRWLKPVPEGTLRCA